MKTTFLGHELDHPIMNAAGTCKRLEEVVELAKSSVSAIMVGSITIEPRDGNPGNVWEHLGHFSINSLGLPNPGLAYYKQHLPEMKRIAADNGKLLIVSVAGFSPDEYVQATAVVAEAGVDIIEENLGCPNIWGGDGQKPIASFDRDLSGEIIQLVGLERVKWLGVKLSPYSNPLELVRFAESLIGHVSFVTTSNTFPNAFACDANGKQLIAPGAGLAGLAGPAMKPVALGQMIQFRQVLGDRVDYVGAGGVSTGQDVLDYVHQGASMVQVGSAFALSHSPKAFESILQQYVDLTPEEPVVNR